MHFQPLRLLEPVLEPAVAQFIRLALLVTSAICIAWIALAVIMLIAHIVAFLRTSHSSATGSRTGHVGPGSRRSGASARNGVLAAPAHTGIPGRHLPDPEEP